MSQIISNNPYTGEQVDSITPHTETEIQNILQSSDNQFYKWRETSFAERKQLVLNVASILIKNKHIYANKITKEIGKPISQSIVEVEKCAWLCEYYAENAEEHLKNETINTDAYKSYTTFEPLGIILAIMPWNYPFWQVFRFAIPTLMAGNVCLLKHASNVFGSALNIEEIFLQSRFPKYCFSTLLVGSSSIKSILENPLVKAVSLTGSGAAGSSVASIAGKNIKKSVLELGGNNALVVLNDCDIDKTVKTCVNARFLNTGQSCIAGKRLLVEENVSEEFIDKLILEVTNLKSGDPKDDSTYIGTLAREDLAIELENQVLDSIESGAILKLGGQRKGAYFSPTILTEVTSEMSVFKEETFGPVLAITTFKGIEEAIKLSNKSTFGLGVSIFSEDIEKIESYISKFDEGAVFVNELVKSDPRLPFGGIKESGFGRELGKDGILEFVNKKTVYINK